METEKVIVYSPDRILKMGVFAVWKEMFLSLFRNRELIWRLFLRDFSARYRQSLFGVLWAVLNPLITVGIFVYLNKSGVFNIPSTNIPYPALALVGVIDNVNAGKNFFGYRTLSLEEIKGFDYETIIITSFQSGDALTELLLKTGVESNSICDISTGGWLKRVGVEKENSPISGE